MSKQGKAKTEKRKSTGRPPAVRKTGGRRGGLRAVILFLGYVLFGLLVIFEPTIAALIVAGLAPSLVALAFDHGAFRRPRLITLSCFNLAGFLPYLAALLKAPDRVAAFFNMVTDIYVWAVIYGSAALGAGMLWIGPFIAAIILQALNEDRVKKVSEQQLALVQEWGPEVKE